MSEPTGDIHQTHDTGPQGLAPGRMGVMSAHSHACGAFTGAVTGRPGPHNQDDTMHLTFETRLPRHPTGFATTTAPTRDEDPGCRAVPDSGCNSSGEGRK